MVTCVEFLLLYSCVVLSLDNYIIDAEIFIPNGKMKKKIEYESNKSQI